MKLTTKYSLLLVLSVFSFQTIKAQSKNFNLGFKVIPGFNWIKSKTSAVKTDGSGIGFSFGFLADIKMVDNYYFTAELNVTSMTNRMKLKDTATLPDNSVYSNVTRKYNLKYIELPLTFKFKTNPSNGVRYWGQFGIAPGFIISNSVTTTANPTGSAAKFPDEKYIPNAKDNNKYDFSGHEDNINVFRAAMILGAGIEYNLSGNTSFYAGLRFNNGFTDILNSKKDQVINNVFGLELGLLF